MKVTQKSRIRRGARAGKDSPSREAGLDKRRHPRHRPRIMALRRYTPPIHRLQEEYSAEIARRWRRARRGPIKAGPKIMDNSEPWNSDPRTVADLWEIAAQVNELVKAWGPRS